MDAYPPRDGTFYSIWGDSAPDSGGFHVGLDSGAADGSLPGGLKSDPGVGVDSQTGRVVAGWNLIDGGVVVMSLSPPGPPTTLPNSGASQLQHRLGITGRIGAPGVFVAYTQGSNEFSGDPALFRVDTGKATKVSGKHGEKVSTAAAPAGRLWVFWKDGGTVFATRSNKAATKFGALRKLTVPGGRAATIFDLAGEGSLGPLDLLALVGSASGNVANYHQRILPGRTVKAKGKKGKVVVKVTDAGDPVSGAKVKVKGGGSKTTARGGSVTFSLSKGKHAVSASRSGYASGSSSVRVR